MAALPISAYVVLGLLDRYDTATPYQLDQWIQHSIGNFWAFPRSQLYAEAERLARRGLVSEQRETEGRRRRTLTITDQGRKELADWLTKPPRSATEIHDEGVLRLFFQPDDAAPDVMARLAGEQLAAHRERLEAYEAVADKAPMSGPQRAALEVGMRFERLVIGFWSEIEDSPGRLPGS